MKLEMPGTQFRTLFRRYTTGVALIGVKAKSGPTGMTVNSLTPLSLDPPLLLFCAKNESLTARRIADVGRFSVNLLTADQEGASRYFAGATCATRTWRWRSAYDCPYLEGANGVFLCSMEGMHEGGDHRIIVGRIDNMFGPEMPLTPLLYHGGRYAKLPLPETRTAAVWEDLWWTG